MNLLAMTITTRLYKNYLTIFQQGLHMSGMSEIQLKNWLLEIKKKALKILKSAENFTAQPRKRRKKCKLSVVI